MIATIVKTDSETLRQWLRENTRLLNEHDPATDAAEIDLCEKHIRDIRSELVNRAEN